MRVTPLLPHFMSGVQTFGGRFKLRATVVGFLACVSEVTKQRLSLQTIAHEGGGGCVRGGANGKTRRLRRLS